MGGRITAIAPSPHDPSRVLIGGDMLGVGLSTDAGQHWQGTFGFSSWEINDFTWDPRDPNTVWVGTLSGPYRSVDGGQTWQSRRKGMPTGDYPYSAPIQKVLIDPSSSDHLIAVGGSQREMLAAKGGVLNYGKVYESADSGASWQIIGQVGADLNVRGVVSTGPDFKRLLAATPSGAMRSDDSGRTWSASGAGMPARGVTSLAVDPGDPSAVWASVNRSAARVNGEYQPGGIYKSSDGGATWAAANSGLSQRASATANYASDMPSVFRAGDGTLYTSDLSWWNPTRFKSTDGGRTWQAMSDRVTRFYSGAPAPGTWGATADGATVYGGYESLIVSTDRGSSWSDLSARKTSDGTWKGNGYSGLLGTRVRFSSAKRGLMLLNSFDGGSVLRSTTGGDSWSRPTSSWDSWGGGYDSAFGGPDDSVAYAVLGQAGIFNGIARSTDGGATWAVATGNGLPARYATGAAQGSVAVASSDGATAFAVLPNGRLYRTVDTGASWKQVDAGSDIRAVTADAKAGVVFAASDRGVLRSGATGTFALLPGSPSKLSRLVLSPRGTLYGVGALGAPKSRSGLWALDGSAWKQLSTQQWASDVAIDPSDPNRIALATNDQPYHDTSFATGLWLSEDGGQTFKQKNTGLPMTRIYSVAFDPWTPGRLVAGTNGGGFWQVNTLQ